MNITQTREILEDRITVVVTIDRRDMDKVYDQPRWALVRQLLREAEIGDGVDALYFCAELALLLRTKEAQRQAAATP